MTILFHPVVPWLIAAAIAAVCAWLIYDLKKQRRAQAKWAHGMVNAYEAELDAFETALGEAEQAREAYKQALAQAQRRSRAFDWRDSHLGTRVSDDNALTRVWERPL